MTHVPTRYGLLKAVSMTVFGGVMALASLGCSKVAPKAPEAAPTKPLFTGRTCVPKTNPDSTRIGIRVARDAELQTIQTALWSRDQQSVLTFASRGAVLWSLPTRTMQRAFVLPRGEDFRQLVWSPDGRWVGAVGRHDVCRWDTTSSNEAPECFIRVEEGNVWWSSDVQWLGIERPGTSVRVVNPSAPTTIVRTIDMNPGESVVDLSPLSGLAIHGAGRTRLIDWATGRADSEMKGEPNVILSENNDAQRAILTNDFGQFWVIEPSTNKVVYSEERFSLLRRSRSLVQSWSDDGSLFVVGPVLARLELPNIGRTSLPLLVVIDAKTGKTRSAIHAENRLTNVLDVKWIGNDVVEAISYDPTSKTRARKDTWSLSSGARDTLEVSGVGPDWYPAALQQNRSYSVAAKSFLVNLRGQILVVKKVENSKDSILAMPPQSNNFDVRFFPSPVSSREIWLATSSTGHSLMEPILLRDNGKYTPIELGLTPSNESWSHDYETVLWHPDAKRFAAAIRIPSNNGSMGAIERQIQLWRESTSWKPEPLSGGTTGVTASVTGALGWLGDELMYLQHDPNHSDPLKYFVGFDIWNADGGQHKTNRGIQWEGSDEFFFGWGAMLSPERVGFSGKNQSAVVLANQSIRKIDTKTKSMITKNLPKELNAVSIRSNADIALLELPKEDAKDELALLVIDIAAMKTIATLENPGEKTNLNRSVPISWAPSGTMLAAIVGDGGSWRGRIWDTRNGSLIAEYPGEGAVPARIDWDADERIVLFSNRTGGKKLRLSDCATMSLTIYNWGKEPDWMVQTAAGYHDASARIRSLLFAWSKDPKDPRVATWLKDTYRPGVWGDF